MQKAEKDFFDVFDFKQNLVISWPVGVGKTHTAKKLLQKAKDSDKYTYEISDAKFKKLVQSQMMNHRHPEDWQSSLEMYPLEMILRSTVLLYDDVGVSDISDPYVRDLTYILDERVKAKKYTIFTTNLTEAELREKLPEHIVSRILFDATVIVMSGLDRRRETTQILSYSE